MSMPTSAATPERVLQRLDWQVIRRLDGLLQGDYRSLFYGFGVDFADLREYQANDDIRYIDWNVTARMNTPYVRQYTEDREVSAWFLLDMSPPWTSVRWNIRREARLIDRFCNGSGALVDAARESRRCNDVWKRHPENDPGTRRATASAAAHQ